MFTISKLKSSTRAAALVEYVALLGLVGVVTITAVVQFGGEAADTFDGTSDILLAQGLGAIEEIPAPATTPTAPTFPDWPVSGDTFCVNWTTWDTGSGYGSEIFPGMTFGIYFGPLANMDPSAQYIIEDTDGDGLIDSAEYHAAISRPSFPVSSWAWINSDGVAVIQDDTSYNWTTSTYAAHTTGLPGVLGGWETDILPNLIPANEGWEIHPAAFGDIGGC